MSEYRRTARQDFHNSCEGLERMKQVTFFRPYFNNTLHKDSGRQLGESAARAIFDAFRTFAQLAEIALLACTTGDVTEAMCRDLLMRAGSALCNIVITGILLVSAFTRTGATLLNGGYQSTPAWLGSMFQDACNSVSSTASDLYDSAASMF